MATEAVGESPAVRRGVAPGWPPPQAQLSGLPSLSPSSLSVCLSACSPTPPLPSGAADVGGWPPRPASLADKYPAGRPCVWPEEPEPLSPSSLPFTPVSTVGQSGQPGIISAHLRLRPPPPEEISSRTEMLSLPGPGQPLDSGLQEHWPDAGLGAHQLHAESQGLGPHRAPGLGCPSGRPSCCLHPRADDVGAARLMGPAPP